MLIEDSNARKNDTGHALYGCELGAQHIVKTSNKLPSLHFTSEVVKTQRNDL